jgi:hypothetical protein
MADYELFTATTAHELWERIDVAAHRFTGLLEQVSPDLPVRDSAWSARDVAAHVLTVVRRYTQGPTLGDTPRDVDRINRDELAAVGDASCDDLLADLRAELKLARELFAPEQLDLHVRIPFHGGAQVDLAAALSNVIAEFLVHGYDVACSADRPWPLDERDCVLILNGVVQIVPAYANRSATASLRVKLVVPGAREWLLAFDRGQLASAPAEGDDPVDVVVRASARSAVLALYGRESSVDFGPLLESP